MRETKHYCDLCGEEKTKYELFDVALHLTERSNSNLQGQRTIYNSEVCKSCLEKDGIIPTNKITHESFGVQKYGQEHGIKGVFVLIKKWFRK